MTRRHLPLGAAADAPEPPRARGVTASTWHAGRKGTRSTLVAGAPMPLEVNLDAYVHDEDTEETPPTAVPGAYRFGLSWTSDEDDDEDVESLPNTAPVPPEDDVAAALAEAEVASPSATSGVDVAASEPAVAPAAVESAAPPVVAPPPPRTKGPSPAVPGWLWLTLGLIGGAAAAWLLVN